MRLPSVTNSASSDYYLFPMNGPVSVVSFADGELDKVKYSVIVGFPLGQPGRSDIDLLEADILVIYGTT